MSNVIPLPAKRGQADEAIAEFRGLLAFAPTAFAMGGITQTELQLLAEELPRMIREMGDRT